MAEAKKKTPAKRSSTSAKRSTTSAKRSTDSRKSANGSATDIAREAVRQLHSLTGRPIEAVLGIEKNGREWAVTVEVLELERVPNTTDVLGQYQVSLDNKGELVSARRTRRYLRSQSGED